MEIPTATTEVGRPHISVIIPTFNRATLLRASLASLAAQSLPRDEYEVVVINDGSTDDTAEVCAGFAAQMALRTFRIANSGISAAKNLGVFTARAPVILFFDDDDTAHPGLLEQHVAMHRQNPEENLAVLGHTTWAPDLDVTPLMEYILEIGQFLFAYKNLSDGQLLDFSYFWGGRTSCKRSLLAAHGIFNPNFRSIIEDIELGYRLAKFGLKVVFNRHAASYMVRPIGFDDFCRRSERQGRGMALFSQTHPEPAARQYCHIPDPIDCPIAAAAARWRDIEAITAQKVRRVRELDIALAAAPAAVERQAILSELRTLWRWTFNAFKVKGAAAGLAENPPLGKFIHAPA
jgi:cellulose synthase/poly-beta-1,6-N-acetylglucosamine synthase-like glycosyltransferase